jgi:hypothetical protein
VRISGDLHSLRQRLPRLIKAARTDEDANEFRPAGFLNEARSNRLSDGSQSNEGDAFRVSHHNSLKLALRAWYLSSAIEQDVILHAILQRFVAIFR